jgi:hypothetical protein
LASSFCRVGAAIAFAIAWGIATVATVNPAMKSARKWGKR